MLHVALAVNDRNKSIMSTLISLFTWSAAYHSELVFTDGAILTADRQGVRWVAREYDRYHWVFLPLPWIDLTQEKSIRDWADKIVTRGAKYDWLGALCGRWNSSIEDPDKWFCSELCAAALKPYTPALDTNTWISPKKLWEILAIELTKQEPKYNQGYRFYYRERKAKSSPYLRTAPTVQDPFEDCPSASLGEVKFAA